MNNIYTPDNWIVFEAEVNGKTERFVLGGWSGGYLDGDSWRRNSGIERVEDAGDILLFHGYSGSIYKCHKKTNVVRLNIVSIWSAMREHHGAREIKLDQILKELKE